MSLMGRVFGRRRAGRVDPGPTNTSTLLFADPVLRSHEPEDHGEGTIESDLVTGVDQLQGEALARWCIRDAQATTRRVRLLLAAGTNDAPWQAALPGHLMDGDTTTRRKDPALAVLHVDAAPGDRVGQLRSGLHRVADDPFVLLLDARMPLVGPDTILLLQERLARHDVCAFHLDGYWVAEPSLWRTEALAQAIQQATAAGHQDTGSLIDLVDARPLDEGSFEALLAGPEELRAIVTKAGLAAATSRLDTRRHG